MPTVSTFSNYGRCRTPDKKRLPVDVDRVTKRFRPMMSRLPGFRGNTSFTSVNRVSFQVGLGEMVGLLGPNGAGKTTLLKMIATLISPSEGQIRFFGKDNRSSAVRERGLVGLVTCDERSFYWRLTGWQNLMFFAALYRIPKKIAGQRSGELLDALGLSHAANRRFDSYSAGMKQKLAIARGLLADPAIVLYDEPT
ncbi:MAG: ABC transporter ATP-binding protein, partial [Gammaproteobacteria bacterium]